ncbi:DctM-like transporter [Halomonas elongata]|uniref:DctM-like transporter n=1 Tax=Halomonas elongata TaxID=2746 RepID=A0A1B8NVN9_HALEL|nr:TRAP transporter large permease subunit [Halomonas elongata]OBX34081.1 DctM-like transporter [Halomonas elongata]
MGIEVVTLLIVLALLALMAFGIPLGVTTLTVSVVTALLYYGIDGLFLVASNVYHVLEKYELVAVPFFVFMANVLERSGSPMRCSTACRSSAVGRVARWRCRRVWWR